MATGSSKQLVYSPVNAQDGGKPAKAGLSPETRDRVAEG